jgi:phenylalanyl-tRNA synthetase beta chain
VPTISIKKKDLESLIGISLSPQDVEGHLQLVKGEFKGYEPEKDELKVELNDSNRPDLWCSEGIARQIKGKLTGEWGDYTFFGPATIEKPDQILVSSGMKDVRPYVGGFTAAGIEVDDEMLVQMIQTQEKVSEVFGSKRRRISIGIYNLSKINFPVYYKDVRPDEISFVPLGLEQKMNLKDILERHPKGQNYGDILRGMKRYPVLVDSRDNVLSFPPIINSREVGEVKVGDRELFVEVTGLDIRLVTLVLNILSVNLCDRGAQIGIVETVYPYDTEFGRSSRIPHDLTGAMNLSLLNVERVMGEQLSLDEISGLLGSYGYRVKKRDDLLEVTPPLYRDDIMHPIDVCEDIAISRGYNSFKPLMPSRMTVGGLSDIELFSDLIRSYMTGSGFQEVISNILTSKEDIIDKMGLGEVRNAECGMRSGEFGVRSAEKVIEVDNVMSLNYSVLRHWILPSLLRVESASTESFYPHKTFEAGEVAVYDEIENLSSITIVKCASLISHPFANFSEIHAILEALMYYLQINYRLVPGDHPSFIEGRMGWIYAGDNEVGLIGEIHPKILTQWDIHMPCSAFEMDADRLLKLYKINS